MAQNSFFYKPLTKDTAQMTLFSVFHESATAKIALCIYLKLTLKTEMMWVVHNIGYQRNMQLLAVTAKAVKVGAGAKAKLKSHE